MIIKTAGVVLKQTRYGESSAIVQIFTREMGMQSYIANGSRGKKKGNGNVLSQPLNCLEMVVHNRVQNDVQRIKEFSLKFPLQNIPFAQGRRAQAFLITEMLTKVLRQEGANHPLFDFLEESILQLDSTGSGLENFHLYFLHRLTSFLGFAPANNHDGCNPWFDLAEGCFVQTEPSHRVYLTEGASSLFSRLFITDSKDLAAIAVNSCQRRELLWALINYYDTHIPGSGNIRSLHVLEELFR